MLGRTSTFGPVGAVATEALGCTKITGLVTNSRLVQAGVRGFQGLSVGARASLKVLGNVAVYAAIAQWAINVSLDAWEISITADLTSTLGDLSTGTERLLNNQANIYKGIDSSFQKLEKRWNHKYDKKYKPNPINECQLLTSQCKQLEKTLIPKLEKISKNTNNLNGVVTRLNSELSKLFKK